MHKAGISWGGLLAALLCLFTTPALAVNKAAVLAEDPAPLLSDYEFFVDGPAQQPAPGVVPYDLATPLFSDYASKYRFVYVPEGQAAQYHPDQAFDFPVGSVLIKTFAFPADLRAPDKDVRLMETRLLIRKEDGWHAYPYVWNADMTDAQLKLAGKRFNMSWIHTDGTERTVRWAVPNKNQCKGCHALKDAITPIGPKARNLNRDFHYRDGVANQLIRWVDIGILNESPDPDKAPRVPVWADAADGTLDERARAYLDVNCAHCHNLLGPASNSGLFLGYNEQDATAWGLRKRPVAAGRGSGGFLFDILPGKPGESILVYRMESTDPGIMMPELGRALVHEEGLKLVRDWITSLEDIPN